MEYTIGASVFGDWKITKKIGEGANGKVFEVQKENYGITTASALKIITIPPSESYIKEIRQEGMDEASVTSYFRGVVEEFVKEIETMNRLKGHPNIVSYEDHAVIPHRGKIGWDILIRMELLTPLMDYQERYQMDETMVRCLGKEIGSAISFCHSNGVVHRDIKPENIFINRVGQFKMGDFGIARTVEKTTGGLSKKGTESYMAPEVFLGRDYGANVDIYSLGMVLYRLMNGNRLPFLPPMPQPITLNDREYALTQRMSGVPVPFPVNASGQFGEIIQKACAYDPKVRYYSADELVRDIVLVETGNYSSFAWSEKTQGLPYYNKGADSGQTIGGGGYYRPINPEPSSDVYEKNKKRRSAKKHLGKWMILLCIVLAASVGGLTVMKMKKQEKKNEETGTAVHTDKSVVHEINTKVTEKPTERITEKVTEKPTERVTEKVTEEILVHEGSWYYITNAYAAGIAIHPVPEKDSATLGRIPYLSEFYVEYIDGNYGYTNYNGCVGWINVGEYAKKIREVTEEELARQGLKELPISAAYFPDEIFRNYVREKIDENENGSLSMEERLDVVEINLDRTKEYYGTLKSLRGIEYFPNLITLMCDYNQVNDLNVSANPRLRTLTFNHNQVRSIDLRNNRELVEIYATDNNLRELDISHNPLLMTVYCDDNYIGYVDTRNNPNLQYLVIVEE